MTDLTELRALTAATDELERRLRDALTLPEDAARELLDSVPDDEPRCEGCGLPLAREARYCTPSHCAVHDQGTR